MNRRLTIHGMIIGNALLLSCFVVINWAVDEYDLFEPFERECATGTYYPIETRLRNDELLGATRVYWDWKGKPLAQAIIDGGDHMAIPRFQWMTEDGQKPSDLDPYQFTAIGEQWSEYNLMFKKVRTAAKGDAI